MKSPSFSVDASRAASGFSLVELMIALVIALVTVVAALEVYARGREVYRVNERVARLQEQGRTALAMIEPDVELAGYYGFTRSAEVIRLVAGASPDVTIATALQLRQFPLRPEEPPPAAVAGLPTGAHACGVNFAVDVSMPVQGSNDVFAMGRSPGTTCKPYQGAAQPGADTLTLRRVATQPGVAEANRFQVYASRHESHSSQLMFVDGTAPGVIDEHHQVHDLIVRTYYIARDSVGQRDFPALRVKSLTRFGAGVIFDEDEVMSGIEDLQVQFGIAGDVRNGRATHYVDPDSAGIPAAQVVSVRVWLRVRADLPEPSFTDARTYQYANVSYTPSGSDRHYRRVLLSRTIALRNARAT